MNAEIVDVQMVENVCVGAPIGHLDCYERRQAQHSKSDFLLIRPASRRCGIGAVIRRNLAT